MRRSAGRAIVALGACVALAGGLVPATAYAAASGAPAAPGEARAQGQAEVHRLEGDVQADVVIPESASVTIDLAGHRLANKGNADTIVVRRGATLTVVDSVGGGSVDNVTHGRAALRAEEGSTVSLQGGTFERSQEAGTAAGANGNSFYAVVNQGFMRIGTGATVRLVGRDGRPAPFSSVIDNGWYAGAPSDPAYRVHLVICGGVVEGGKYLKNDSYGVLEITSGEVRGGGEACILNWNDLTISGGTLTAAKGSGSVVLNAKAGAAEQGHVEVLGGTFVSDAKVPLFGSAAGFDRGDVSVSAGTFQGPTVDPSWVDEDSGLVPNDGGLTAHVHHWTEGFSSDADGHWRECTEPGCTVRNDGGPHVAAPERVGAYEPTQDQPGFTGDLVCATCGRVLEAGEQIPALRAPGQGGQQGNGGDQSSATTPGDKDQSADKGKGKGDRLPATRDPAGIAALLGSVGAAATLVSRRRTR